jgi:hypothetical protein
MRSILFASAAILIASSAPSLARDYSSCAPAMSGPGSNDCALASYRQCRAGINGRHGDCGSDPRLAAGRTSSWRQSRDEAHDYDFWHDNPHGWNFWH